MVPIKIHDQDFIKLMNLYKKAQEQILKELNLIRDRAQEVYGYDMINNITYRIKSPESIIKKMETKHYELNYRNLIKKVNDIAGIRITCPFKSDISIIRNTIKNMPDLTVIEEKNYIKKPKRSGYSAYHLIVKTPVNIDEQIFFVKVEIQIRTIAMDSWSIAEHKIKYKTNNNLSIVDSKKLSMYAKIINVIDTRMMRLYQKHVKNVKT